MYGRHAQSHVLGAPRRLGKFTAESIIPQPGDGSCLFHALGYGLDGQVTAQDLRHRLLDYLERHPFDTLAGDTLEEWVRWDTGSTVAAYVARMRGGTAWGGGVEIAICTLLFPSAQINVYEPVREFPSTRMFWMVAQFGSLDAPQFVIHLLYRGRAHYDSLVGVTSMAEESVEL